MISPAFKKTVVISLVGHITVFGIFSFSFGDRISKANFANVSFLGSILHKSDLSNKPFTPPPIYRWGGRKRLNTSALDGTDRGYTLVLQQYSKPLVPLPFNEEKIIFIPEVEPISFVQKRKEPIVIFYPQLPYHFLLYFKDRQTVHIELMFNIISNDKTNSIAIKRKISSGNLEADFLSMRYICHYLSIQQMRFVPNNWQTVKIDLSAKEQ